MRQFFCSLYDAKFFSDLMTAPLDVPWKVWTCADLVQVSSHRPLQQPGYHHRVDPLLQHAFTRLKDLEPRLRQAYMSLRSLRYNITSVLPSLEARTSMPLLYHPALPPKLSRAPDTLLLNWDSRKPSWRRRVGHIMAGLDSSSWHLHPSPPSLADPESVSFTPRHGHALDCARILSGPASLLYAQSGIGKRLFYGNRTRHSSSRVYPPPSLPPFEPARPLMPDLVTVWTDGSALRNGSDQCVAGSAWYSEHCAPEYARLADDIIPSNNIAEVVAVVMALRAWHGHNLLIITDSKYVLKLVGGKLLDMECCGWTDLPVLHYKDAGSLSSLFQHLLYLL